VTPHSVLVVGYMVRKQHMRSGALLDTQDVLHQGAHILGAVLIPAGQGTRHRVYDERRISLSASSLRRLAHSRMPSTLA
jgi:hypothetical protein